MVNIRYGLLRAACVAAASTLLAGCGFLNSGSMVTPTPMTVSSEAFSQNVLPHTFTCYSTKPISPPLSWSGAPAGTKGYALVVDDASAPITPFIYWIVFHIGPGTTDIQQGALPSDARQALNSANTARYDAPCPVGGAHQYRFTVYALDTVLNLPNGTSLLSAWTAIAAATIGRGRAEPFASP
jgi:Raf kinase inhibitor-like YbhB/YbcL family protein